MSTTKLPNNNIMQRSLKFLTVILLCILSGAEVDLFIPSFPELQKVFKLSPFKVQLTLSVNFIAYCVSSFFAGTLGDSLGRRKVLLMGLIIFTIGSTCCLLANNFALLVLGRFLQGAGIAAPCALAFVVIADEYSIEKQHSLMGILNGIVTFAMALAPVIGSYVNLYFDWRGNFVVLLSLGIICLILAYKYIPETNSHKNISWSLGSYICLFESKKMIAYLVAIVAGVVPYWMFIGLAPILYMQDLGVSLKEFGFYQGALAAVFALVSIISGKLIKTFGLKNCFNKACQLCLLGIVLILVLGLLKVHNALIITGTLIILSAAVAMPFNILYPLSLEVIEGAKARIAATITAFRLIFTASSLSIVSYYYDGTFFNIAIAMFLHYIIAVYAVWLLIKNSWLNLEDK